MIASRPRNLIWPAAVLIATLAADAFWEVLLRLLGGSLWLIDAEDGRRVLATIGWLALAWLVSRIVDLALMRAMARSGRRAPRLLNDLMTGLLFALAVLAIIAFVFRLPITGLIATSGVLVAILGFALRDIISDIFSGLAVNFETPYRIGDWIEVEDRLIGQVVEINWRATRLVTKNQVMVVVPNGKIAGRRLKNFSAPQRWYRAQVPISLDYDVPVERARRVLLAAARGVPGLHPSLEPDVKIDGFGERGLTYLVRYWVPDFNDDVDCRDAVAASMYHHLRLAGIAIPHGRSDVTLTRVRSANGSPRADIDKPGLLRNVPLLAPLSDADILQLAECGRVQRIPVATDVVREGNEGAALYLLIEGLLRVCQGPEQATLALLQPGEVFGEMSLLTGAPCVATVRADTEATVFEITRERLRPILQRSPELLEALSRILDQRVQANRDVQERARNQPAVAAPAEPPPSLLGRVRSFLGLKS